MMDRESAADVDIHSGSQCNEDVSIGKRKRVCILESLEWVKNVARDPCNPVYGCLPDKMKWSNFGEDQQWRQVLLFRQDTRVKLNAANSTAQQSIWQIKKAMFPSMYDDRRQSSRCTDSLAGPWFKECSFKTIPVGIICQAEIPDWCGDAYESDTKWLGTRIWPQEASQENCDVRVPTEFGRLDQCGCELRGSYECVRFHVSEERKRLKLELGMPFYQWQIDKMGEEVASSWTRKEETMFEKIVRLNPPSKGKKLWAKVHKKFSLKKRKQLMSYYFNVYLLRRRGQQNRVIPMNISSDDDGLEFKKLHMAPVRIRSSKSLSS